MSSSFHVISGCSGSGKSTLLAELGRRGFATVPEPGRLVVREQLAAGGDALPWQNGWAFISLVLERAVEQYERADSGVPTFFDRGILDAACGILTHGGQLPARFEDVLQTHPYAARVFMTPPWEEIFRTDRERRHTFADGVADYEAKLPAYRALGYEVVRIPKAPVAHRAEFVLGAL